MFKEVTPHEPGKPYNYLEFLCDIPADLNDLLTNKDGKAAIGSIAFVVNPKSSCILNNCNEYVLMSSGDSASGGGIPDVDLTTNAEITSMLDDVY